MLCYPVLCYAMLCVATPWLDLTFFASLLFSLLRTAQFIDYPQRDGGLCKLGFWVNKQRKNRRSGSLSRSREDRLQNLVNLGLFRWSTYFSAASNTDADAADDAADIRPDHNQDEHQDEEQEQEQKESESGISIAHQIQTSNSTYINPLIDEDDIDWLNWQAQHNTTRHSTTQHTSCLLWRLLLICFRLVGAISLVHLNDVILHHIMHCTVISEWLESRSTDINIRKK